MSKRWVKFSRGILLGSLIILGSSPASAEEAPPRPTRVNIFEAGQIAREMPAFEPAERVRRQAGNDVDLILDDIAQTEPDQEPTPSVILSPEEEPDVPSAQSDDESQEQTVDPDDSQEAVVESDDPKGDDEAERGEVEEFESDVESDSDVDSDIDGEDRELDEPDGLIVEPDEPIVDPAQNEDVGPPPIVDIEVEGNTSIPSNAILEVVSTRIGDPLLEPRLRRDLQAIFDLGYFTDVRFATPAAPGGIRLVFRVLENPMVNTVEFRGNEVVDSAVLRARMDTESGQILNTRTIHSDIQAINQFYNEELGYLHTPTHVTDVSFEDGNLILTVEDGIIVSEVEVTGVSVYPEERVSQLVRIKPGELFNRKVLEEDLSRINELYDKDEWVLDTVDPKIDPETGQLTIHVIEAEVEEIRVEGNTKTRTATILRNLRTKPGSILNRRRFQKDLERLNNLGYFRTVDPDPQRGSDRGKVILVLDVEEEKTGLATIGVGYAGGGSSGIRSGVTGAISYTDRNLFGEGKNVSVSWQRGAQISSIGVSYLDPAINDNQDSIGISLFRNDVDGLRQPITVGGEQEYAYYDDERMGGSFTYGHPLNDDLRIFGTLRHETIKILRGKHSIYEPIGVGTGTLNSVGLSALYDTRDDIFNPHVGSYANASISVAGLGGDYNFTRYTVEGRHYVPLGDKHTLALRGWGGIVTGDAPITEYFYAGGPDTLRGYQQNQFFGTRFFVANAEYRFPIANIKFLRGAVFADAGTAYTPGDRLNNRIFFDAGLGLRITFPALGLGVIRLDYAIGEDGGRTQIGIGQSF